MTKRDILATLALVIVAIPIVVSNWLHTFDKGTQRISVPAKGHIGEMAFDNQGRIWACHDRYVSVSQEGQLVETFEFSDVGSYLPCKSIIVDHKGNVWVGTLFHGLRMFDGESWTTFFDGTHINSLAVDSSNNVWVGLERGDGIAMFDGTSWTLFDETNSSLTMGEYESLAIDNKDHVWVGDSLGLNGPYVYDGKNWQIYEKSEFGRVSFIGFDKDGKGWIGHTLGSDAFADVIVTFDGTQLVYLATASSSTTNFVSEIFFDNRDRAWILMYGGNVFIVYDDGKLRYYLNFPNESEYYSSEKMGADGRIWLASTKGGFLVLTPEELKLVSKPIGTLMIFFTTGGIWFIEILLICIWLAYALNSWKGIGIGSGVGAVLAVGAILLILGRYDTGSLLDRQPFLADLSGRSTSLSFFSLLGFALMIGGGIGGLFGKILSKPDKRNREMLGVIIGWVVAIAFWLFMGFILLMGMS